MEFVPTPIASVEIYFSIEIVGFSELHLFSVITILSNICYMNGRRSYL
jgi:hypothetical protein